MGRVWEGCGIVWEGFGKGVGRELKELKSISLEEKESEPCPVGACYIFCSDSSPRSGNVYVSV